MLVTHATTSAYFERLSQRYGSALSSFVRYYVQPGFGHGGGTFQMSWDSLSVLEAWAEQGQAPAGQTSVDISPTKQGRSRPLCEYPLWPKYNGSGDPNQAVNFTCVGS